MKRNLSALDYDALLKFALQLQEENEKYFNATNGVNDDNAKWDLWVLLLSYLIIMMIFFLCHDELFKVSLYQAAASFDLAVTTVTSEFAKKSMGVEYTKLCGVFCLIPLICQIGYIFFILYSIPKQWNYKRAGIVVGLAILAFAYFYRFYHVSNEARDHPFRPFFVVICFLVVSASGSWDFIQSILLKKEPVQRFYEKDITPANTPPSRSRTHKFRRSRADKV